MPDPQASTPKADILIVDDNPDNLRVLSTMLRVRGYRVRGALNGEIALKAAQTKPPDLILLDIMMPEINGYELCQQLKGDRTTRKIPVIFISALNQGFDKAKAFKVGGADYITKPFQIEEAIARIEHQLTIKMLQHQLEQQNRQLQEEIKIRKRVEAKVRKLNAALESRVFQRTMQLEVANRDIFKEVAENKLLEQQLRTSEAEMQALFEAMSDIVLVLDDRASQIDVMPTQAARGGQSKDDPVAVTVKRFSQSPQAETFLKPVRQAIETQQMVNFEYSLSIDGERIWFSASIASLSEPGAEGAGESPRVIWVARNITELKRAQAQLKQLTHQLDTPISN